MKLDVVDVFVFTGLILMAYGITVEFSPAFAAIVIGFLLFATAIWKAR